MKHIFAIFKHWILFNFTNFIECFCGKKFLKNWFSILTWRILTMDRIAWYFLRSLYMVSDIFSLSSETCFEVISEKNQICIFDIKRKVSFPPSYSIHFDNHSSISCCLCKKHGWSGRSGLENVQKFWWYVKTTTCHSTFGILLTRENGSAIGSLGAQWFQNPPKISRYFLRENSNYFNLK